MSTSSIRVLNRPEDYERMGIKAGQVEPWEDGVRNSDEAGSIEWWYFDTDLDDGTKIGVNFATNPVLGSQEKGYHPFVYYNIQYPDGRVANKFMLFTADDIRFGEGGCDVQIGQNRFRGNLKEYHLSVQSDEGVKMDLTLRSTSTSWRPGTAYMRLEEAGSDDGRIFTWLCAVPRGEVSGTLTHDGETHEVRGMGYHDHQWATAINYRFWNRWFWGRQQTDDYVLVIFDLVSTRETGHKHVPLFFIEDKDGKLLFDNQGDTEGVTCEVLSHSTHPQNGKQMPIESLYTFRRGDITVEYRLTAKDEIVYTDHRARATAEQQAALDKMGLYNTYSRYLAIGEFTMRRGTETLLHFEGETLYEISSQYKDYIL